MTDTPPLPRELQVEVTGACNLKCRMCLVRYRPPLGRVTASLTQERFRALLDALPDARRVTLQGLGEPLLAPDLMAMLAEARGRGIEVGFNTNGMLLTRERAARLVALGVDWIHVSLDGATAATHEDIRDGADFQRIGRNVQGLVRTRARAGRERPRIQLNVVAMRRNVAELPALVMTAARWGVDRVWVQNLSHSFGDRRDDPAFDAIREFTSAEALWDDPAAAEAFATARAFADATGLALRLPSDAAERATRRARRPACTWPWRSAYVRQDGAVQPCCMLMGEERGILGNLRDADFATVWRGDAYRRFRRQLMHGEPPDVCRGCSELRGVF
jgi:radical SAM protein with 4Fe4S-binding SPASM domain